MKKLNLLVALMAFTLLFVSCGDDDTTKDDDTDGTETGTKPDATSIKFEATGVDCGLNDGFSNQQHSLPQLIHLNLDKCNGETFRPTLTLNFESGETIEPGTYTIATSDTPGPTEFIISAAQYNFTNWEGTAGSVVVTTNEEDDTKIDIELKSITMTNTNSEDTTNGATDILTGYIIKI